MEKRRTFLSRQIVSPEDVGEDDIPMSEKGILGRIGTGRGRGPIHAGDLLRGRNPKDIVDRGGDGILFPGTVDETRVGASKITAVTGKRDIGKKVRVAPDGVVMLHADPIEELAARRPKSETDFTKVMAREPAFRKKLFRQINEAPDGVDPRPGVREAYKAMMVQMREQYKILTEELGYTVEAVDYDPYITFDEMMQDMVDNKRLRIMATSVTGSHPLLTDEENDMLRAVHDAFGHAATGRGFDRHGEEAAYQAHLSMFDDVAQQALASEFRAQTAYLIEARDFMPVQKATIMSKDLIKRMLLGLSTKADSKDSVGGTITADDDNLYSKGKSHHVSGGRHFAFVTSPKRKVEKPDGEKSLGNPVGAAVKPVFRAIGGGKRGRGRVARDGDGDGRLNEAYLDSLLAGKKVPVHKKNPVSKEEFDKMLEEAKQKEAQYYIDKFNGSSPAFLYGYRGDQRRVLKPENWDSLSPTQQDNWRYAAFSKTEKEKKRDAEMKRQMFISKSQDGEKGLFGRIGRGDLLRGRNPKDVVDRNKDGILFRGTVDEVAAVATPDVTPVTAGPASDMPKAVPTKFLGFGRRHKVGQEGSWTVLGEAILTKPADTKHSLRNAERQYVPERLALHDRIVDHIVKLIPTKPKPRGKRTVFLAGGGPASGKTEMLKHLEGIPGKDSAHYLSADDIKELIPEYQNWVDEGIDAAELVHGESKHINKKTTARAAATGNDIVLDSTGDGNYHDHRKRLMTLKDSGYRIEAHYVTTSLENALARERLRYEATGRGVPEDQLVHIHRQVSRVVPHSIDDGLYDEFSLWSNDGPAGSAPTLIAHLVDGRLVKLDEAAWQAFIAKGTGR